MEEFYLKYKKLRDEIDALSQQLEKQHQKHMKCQAGCDQCCMDYSIFPIEFYSILDALKQAQTIPGFTIQNDKSKCVFLNAGQCTIYTERPVICRTHGLPLLYMNENEEWELSACELNFTAFNMDKFTDENTFPQDKFNSRLFMLNKQFISVFSEKEYGDFDLIPVRKLIGYL